MNAQLQMFVVIVEIVATLLVLLSVTVRLGTDQIALISHAKVRLPYSTVIGMYTFTLNVNYNLCMSFVRY